MCSSLKEVMLLRYGSFISISKVFFIVGPELANYMLWDVVPSSFVLFKVVNHLLGTISSERPPRFSLAQEAGATFQMPTYVHKHVDVSF